MPPAKPIKSPPMLPHHPMRPTQKWPAGKPRPPPAPPTKAQVMAASVFMRIAQAKPRPPLPPAGQQPATPPLPPAGWQPAAPAPDPAPPALLPPPPTPDTTDPTGGYATGTPPTFWELHSGALWLRGSMFNNRPRSRSLNRPAGHLSLTLCLSLSLDLSPLFSLDLPPSPASFTPLSSYSEPPWPTLGLKPLERPMLPLDRASPISHSLPLYISPLTMSLFLYVPLLYRSISLPSYLHHSFSNTHAPRPNAPPPRPLPLALCSRWLAHHLGWVAQNLVGSAEPLISRLARFFRKAARDPAEIVSGGAAGGDRVAHPRAPRPQAVG